MATPLTPIPPSPRPAQTASRRRAAIGAGFTAVAAAVAIAVTPSAALAQDDTYAQDNAWVPELVQAPAAWETTQGEGITVAVLDTGINEHPFFEGKDVLPGHSAASSEEDGWNDTDGHGSAVAAGVLLVAPEATIMPVRVGTGESILSGALGPTQFDAFRWAVDNGADILVVPWGLSGASQDTFDGEYLEVLQYAIDKGAIVIAAAGNEAGEPVEYPAFVPGVVAVTGTDRNGNIWYENTTVGPEIAVAAPADEMTAPLPQDSSLGNTELYRDVIGGTSMGSGITGGVAALAWAAHPQLDASNVIQRMIQTAGEGSGGKSDDFGYGLLNADQAVHAQDIAPVEENPLGYPMGEAGASGVSPDEASSEEAAESSPAPAGPSAAAAEGNKESNLSSIIVVAAAVVLLGAAIAVWLVLRGRGRKSAAPANAGNFRPGDGPGPGAYQQPAAAQQQYSPPMGGGPGFGAPQSPQQGFSSPPPQQGFNPPPGNAEQSPPGRPSDPNRQ